MATDWLNIGFIIVVVTDIIIAEIVVITAATQYFIATVANCSSLICWFRSLPWHYSASTVTTSSGLAVLLL